MPSNAVIGIELGQKGKREKHFNQLPIYYDEEGIRGKVLINIKPGRSMEHLGIKIEFVGAIDIFTDRGLSTEFINLVRELAPPGELYSSMIYPFEFPRAEKRFDSYEGMSVRLRYFVRVAINKKFHSQSKEQDIWVQSYGVERKSEHSIKMEVGIDESLHIEFEYPRARYHLSDVIIGKIFFLLVGVKIKHMELAIIKRETIGSVRQQVSNQTIAKYEIMDGQPVRGECIPIRLFLSGYDLTPTMRDVNKRFSVRYYLNLVLVDEEDRRYFKQQEIILWRKNPKKTVPHNNSHSNPQSQVQVQPKKKPVAPIASSASGDCANGNGNISSSSSKGGSVNGSMQDKNNSNKIESSSKGSGVSSSTAIAVDKEKTVVSPIKAEPKIQQQLKIVPKVEPDQKPKPQSEPMHKPDIKAKAPMVETDNDTFATTTTTTVAPEAEKQHLPSPSSQESFTKPNVSMSNKQEERYDEAEMLSPIIPPTYTSNSNPISAKDEKLEIPAELESGDLF